MASPIPNKVFVDTGDSNQNERNFQHFLFKDLDFTERSEPISFFRSDFRGVKIENVRFYRNSFDRADFVNAYILNSAFKDCSFGTDFTNVIFHNVLFSSNLEDTCAYYNCNFINCSFEEEKIVNTTNRNSNYLNCTFSNCTLERNSFEDIDYQKSTFNQISFAEMGAYNLGFTSCYFNKMTVDPDYLGSYLIKDTDVGKLEYMYRGKEIKLTGQIVEDLGTLSLFYLENERYYEALNSIILINQIDNVNRPVLDLFEKVIELINQDSHDLRRNQSFERIIKMLVFYSDSWALYYEELFFIIGLLESDKIQFESLTSRLKYKSHLQILEDTINSNLFELYLWNFDPEQIIYTEIEIDENDFEIFQNELLKFLSDAEIEYGVDHTNGSYEIIGTRRGSLIVEIAQYAVGAYCLATIAKSVISKGMEIRMEYKIAKKTTKMLETGSIDDLKKWEEKVKISRRIQKKPSDELFLKATPLIKLMRSFNIFPNAFIKRIK